MQRIVGGVQIEDDLARRLVVRLEEQIDKHALQRFGIVGVSALLPNRWQPFVNFRTIQGNENLVNYGGTAGLRVGL